MTKPKFNALYLLLSRDSMEKIYGPVEQADIAARVNVAHPLLTPEDYRASEQVWPEVEIIFSGWDMTPVDEEFLRRFPRLQIIFYGAGTIKYFATPALWQRDVRVTSAAVANAVPVSEFAISQILFGLKQGWQQALFTRANGRYPEPITPAGGYRSIVGLISLGMIGRMVAERLATFDAHVIAYDPFATPEAARRWNIEMVSMDELFSCSDVVSCHAPLLKATEKMIGERHFAAMKPGATFINTARGAVVNEEEMIAVLHRRPDLMAVLDVTHPEPPIPGSPLYSLGNVVLTPHIAGSLGQECQRMGRTMVEELDRFLSEQPLRYEVSEASAATMA